jgi:hypothetical protein
MRVLVSGASGLIGSRVVANLAEQGHQVSRLVRHADTGRSDDVHWNPLTGTIDRESLEGFDAVVHLAGENIAARRWSDRQKSRIRDSRVVGTRLLAEALSQSQQRPNVLISASAIGIYGDRGDEELTEASAPGTGFLADVCQQWEAAANIAGEQNIRVVHLRFGVVLSTAGGALAKMLLPFRLGLGGIVGSGQQYWSWLALDDVPLAIGHVLSCNELEGPVNCVAPRAATNREFTKSLGKVLRRPTVFPMPGFAARILLGEMADDLLLASARVLPSRLEETGYQFRHAELDDALRSILAR